jgi:hypothetical protein
MNDLLLPIKRGREGGDLRGSIVIVFESQWKNLFLYLVLCRLCYSARSESCTTPLSFSSFGSVVALVCSLRFALGGGGLISFPARVSHLTQIWFSFQLRGQVLFLLTIFVA